MARSVFISRSWVDSEWVRCRLAPCLRGAGLNVFVDEESYGGGRLLQEQIRDSLIQSDLIVIVLTDNYLTDPDCQSQMQHALMRPDSGRGDVVTVIRGACSVPSSLMQRLYLDLRRDDEHLVWEKLVHACEGDFGEANIPAWLNALDELKRSLRRSESINLVGPKGCKSRELLTELQQDPGVRRDGGLALVDLQRGVTSTRRGLVREIFNALGKTVAVPEDGGELELLDDVLAVSSNNRLAFYLLDLMRFRDDYDDNLFSALRYLMQRRGPACLVLIAHSRVPLSRLFSVEHPLSVMIQDVVELGIA